MKLAQSSVSDWFWRESVRWLLSAGLDTEQPHCLSLPWQVIAGCSWKAVLLQLAELKRLQHNNPGLILGAGQDIDHMSRLLKSGAIIQGFR